MPTAHSLASTGWAVLSGYMADQIDVVVEMAHKVLTDVLGGTACVADELPLGHLVLHVRAGQIDGQQNE